MKKLIILLVLLNQVFIQAQENTKYNFKPNLVYAHAGLGPNQFSLGLNLIHKNNLGLSLSYNGMTKAAGVLEWYERQSCFFGGDCSPKDYVKTYNLRPSITFPTKLKLIRFGFELGPSLVKTEIAYKVFDDSQQGFRPWKLHYNKNQSLGFSYVSKIEFPVSRYFGLQAACVGNLNKYRSFLGVEIHAVFGIVRDRLKSK